MRALLILVFCVYPIMASALSERSQAIERRLNDFLTTYLEPHEFVAVVNEKEMAPAPALPTESSMPGAPGLLLGQNGGTKFNSYFDLDGKVRGGKGRPPVQIDIIVHRSISPETRNLIKRMIPSVTGLDQTYGDSVQFKVGSLESPTRKRLSDQGRASEKDENAIETLFRHKNDLVSLGLGLATALAILIFVSGVLSIIKERQRKDPSPFPAVAERRPAPPSTTTPATDAPEMSSRPDAVKDKRPTLPDRDALYSKDAAFAEMVEELRVQAENHPSRVAELINRWLQSGDIGIRNASILLHNFNFSAVEKIMDKMVASDLDFLRGYVDLEFDLFSAQNVRVIMEARQELMKIVASSGNQQKGRGFEMLSRLESHILIELFRNEDVRSLVVAGNGIPTHRLAEIIASFPPEKQTEYFNEFCALERIDSKEIERTRERLTRSIESFNELVLTEPQKVEAMVQLLHNMPDERSKVRILDSTAKEHPALYLKIRSMITLFEDVSRLPERALKLLLAEEDPVLVARAFSRHDVGGRQRILDLLPKSSQEIFRFETEAPSGVPEGEYDDACSRLVEKLDQLIYEKVIAAHDVRRFDAPETATGLKRVA